MSVNHRDFDLLKMNTVGLEVRQETLIVQSNPPFNAESSHAAQQRGLTEGLFTNVMHSKLCFLFMNNDFKSI